MKTFSTINRPGVKFPVVALPPSVCITPGATHRTGPVPYPEIQFQENLKKANRVDSKAKVGNKAALKLQKRAIDNLSVVAGIKSQSATQAVLLGRTAHGNISPRDPIPAGPGEPAAHATYDADTSVMLSNNNSADDD